MVEQSIGQQLKTARIASDISVEQLAERLRLSPQKLVMLEKNQFDSIAAPTYVTGYIRSYCEEVNLDSEALLNDYQQQHSLSSQPKLTSTSNQPEQIDAKDPRFITMTIAVLLLLSVLIAIWAWESFKLQNEPVVQVSALPEIEAVFDASVQEATELAASSDKDDIALSTSTVDDNGLDSAQTIAAANDVLDIEEAKAVPVVVEAENVSVPEIIEKKKQTVKVEADGRAPTGDDVIIINVSSQSWVNIEDLNGYRLYYDMLVPSESPLTMRGKAPFEVILGDASVVGLSINNTIYDVKRHMRADKSARFKLK